MYKINNYYLKNTINLLKFIFGKSLRLFKNIKIISILNQEVKSECM